MSFEDTVPITVSDEVAATIQGVVHDSAGGPGLEGVLVRAIHPTSGGLPGVDTDAGGALSIPVTETGVSSMRAIGVLPFRFVNTNCAEEEITVDGSGAFTIDLSIETGYYLGVLGGP